MSVSDGTEGNAGSTVDTSDFIRVYKNKTYAIKGVTSESTYYYNYYICLYDLNKNFVERQNMTSTGLGDKSFLFTPSQDGFIKFSYTHNISELQVELGSLATSYIAHAEKTYNFPLSEGQVLMQDGTIEDKVVNKWEQRTLSGKSEENWLYNGSPGGKYCFTFYLSKTINLSDNTDNKIRIYCDKFKGMSASHIISSNSDYSIAIISNRRLYIKVNSSIGSNVENFKEWLSNNPITIEYELATPEETAFTTEQQSVIDEIINDGTYKEVTHYTAEASINPDMEIGYYKDLEIWVNNLINS